MRLRKVFVSLAAASMIGLPATVAMSGAAQAQQSTCSWNWGIKQSFRSYIKGQIAQGGWEGSGVGFTGDETGSGSFVFTPGTGSVSGDEVTVPFNGTLAFTGHDGALDMTLSDFKVRASGSTAQILVDYVSYKSDMTTKVRGERITGDDVAIATINLSNSVDAASGKLDLTGTTALTSGGHDLFLSYEAGTVLDPSSGVVGTSGGCGTSTGTGTSNDACKVTTFSGEFTGFNKEAMGILKETNDTMNALTTFMCNSQTFLDQVDSFRNRTETGAAKSTSKSTSTNTSTGASTGTSAGTSTRASASGSAGGSASGTGSGSTTSTGTQTAAQCVSAQSVQSAQMAWGVKQSFRTYITGSIAKGQWTMTGVRYGGNSFQFTGNSGAVDAQASRGSLKYSGSLHFTGHEGILNLTISNPEITYSGSTGQLIADVTSSDMEGNSHNFGRTAVATLEFSSLNTGADGVAGEAQAFLTQDGSAAFANFYEPGTQLDPVTFSAQLGGAATCDALAGSATTSGAGGSGAVDSNAVKQAAQEQLAQQQETMGYQDSGNNFKIKNAAASASKGDLGDDLMTWMFLMIAGLIVAGGSLSRLVLNNPA